jgi:hypothetical protein
VCDGAASLPVVDAAQRLVVQHDRHAVRGELAVCLKAGEALGERGIKGGHAVLWSAGAVAAVRDEHH